MAPIDKTPSRVRSPPRHGETALKSRPGKDKQGMPRVPGRATKLSCSSSRSSRHKHQSLYHLGTPGEPTQTITTYFSPIHSSILLLLVIIIKHIQKNDNKEFLSGRCHGCSVGRFSSPDPSQPPSSQALMESLQ